MTLVGCSEARRWLVDQYYLGRLETAPPEERWNSIKILLERKCPAVTPHLLKFYKDHPFEGSLGMTMGYLATFEHRLVSLGPDAVPYLAAAIDHEDAQHDMIFCVLSKFGPRSLGALPALVRYLQGTGGSVGAIDAIGAIGEDAHSAVPALLAFKRYQNDRIRGSLYGSLGQIGPRARAAIPLLLDALDFESGGLLFDAAWAIERIEPGRPEVVPALIACLKAEGRTTREAAADRLADLGSRARDAVPTLVNMMTRDPDAQEVATAAKALDRIDPELGLAESLQMARDEWDEFRRRGFVALGGFASRAVEVMPVLIQGVADSSEAVAVAAIESLGCIGEGSEAAVATLIRICSKAESEEGPANEAIVLAAINALGRIGGGSEGAVAALIRVCRTAESEELASISARSLAKIGPASPDALKAFEGLLPGAGRDSHKIVAQAVALLATRDSAAIEMLIRALAKDRDTKIGAIECLGWVGQNAAGAIPLLSRIAGDASDKELASRAKEALKHIRR